MSGAELGLVVSVFLACAVEAVEALTIVLAVGTTRSWSSALAGTAAAALVLAGLIAGFGPALTALPLDVLRVVIGGFLLVFGLQWLRKAILRAAGLKSKHDEEAIYETEVSAARAAAPAAAGFDGYSFAIALKGVLLEGLEVAFIVLTFGANQHRIGLAAAAAAVAVLLVVMAGIALRAPLARVPENAMKFAVGVMLSSFGMFWGAEGAGAHWPGGEASLVAIVPCLLSLAAVTARGLAGSAALRSAVATPGADGGGRALGRAERVLLAVWEFIVGDDWLIAAGVVLVLSLTAIAQGARLQVWWLTPPAAAVLLVLSLRRALRLR